MTPEETTNFEFPWGKHKGQMVSDIPTDYLDWLIGQSWMDAAKNKALKFKVEAHLQTRADWMRMETSDEGM